MEKLDSGREMVIEFGHDGDRHSMKVYIGADHAGFALKELVASCLRQAGIELVDVGANSADPVDYPVYAFKVARAVGQGQADQGILICGSGIGMCMAANRRTGCVR